MESDIAGEIAVGGIARPFQRDGRGFQLGARDEGSDRLLEQARDVRFVLGLHRWEIQSAARMQRGKRGLYRLACTAETSPPCKTLGLASIGAAFRAKHGRACAQLLGQKRGARQGALERRYCFYVSAMCPRPQTGGHRRSIRHRAGCVN